MLRSIRDGDKLLVGLDGELDHFCAQSVRRELDSQISDPTIRQLILDFSGLTFMDSSGIGVILGRYRILRERGGTVAVIHMNEHISRIFHMSGMGKVIRQLDSKQEARR
ncbi:MAG: anti-sigma F factor antagonist [Clostridia bacterium]|nr:anti-sigma F factor antagonist [Clostridia bacterium]MBQ8312938.1 anti-sigma F factor antagonist [Clostridia bacterium]